MKVIAMGATDTGRVRKNNEDNFLIAQLDAEKKENITEPAPVNGGVVLLVADGMGGAAAGEVASEVVVSQCYEYLSANKGEEPESALNGAIFDAHQEIQNIVRSSPEKNGMGSVATYILLTESAQVLAQIGDTRLYRLRDDKLTQVSEDQSTVANLLKAGKITPIEAKSHPLRNQVNQAIGPTLKLTPEITPVDLKAGDRILLCSDGLNNMVDDDEIIAYLRKTDPLEQIASELISLANNYGGYDNTTIIIADLLD